MVNFSACQCFFLGIVLQVNTEAFPRHCMTRKRWSFSETLCLTRCAHHYPGVHLLVVTSCPPCSLDSQIWLCLRQTPLVNMLPLPNWDFTILPHLFQQWTHTTLTMVRRLLINTGYFLRTLYGWGRFYVSPYRKTNGKLSTQRLCGRQQKH